MSISSHDELPKKEIKLTLEITKLLLVDNNTSIFNIKNLAKSNFGDIYDDFDFFVKEFEITCLENMKILTTLDYYKSNTVVVKEKKFNKKMFNQSLNSNYDKDLLQYRTIGLTPNEINGNNKNKTSCNMPGIIQNNLDDLKKSFNWLNLNINSTLRNKSENQKNNNKNNDSVNSINYLYDNLHKPNRKSHEKKHLIRNNLLPFYKKNPLIDNLNYSGIGYPIGSFKSSKGRSEIDLLLQTDSDFAPRKGEISIHMDYQIPKEKALSLNINPNSYLMTTTNNQLDDFVPNIRVFDHDRIATDEVKILRETNENLNLNNQILNKSILELKFQLKQMQTENESIPNLKSKINELNYLIENLKDEINKNKITNNELMTINQTYDKKLNECINDNIMLKSEIENFYQNLHSTEKDNFELKNNLNSVEEIFKNYENEKSILNLQLNEKEQKIIELNNKIELLHEFNEKIKKSITDYEDMVNNMKRTIEILKRTSDDYEKERTKLNHIIEEKEDLLKIRYMNSRDKEQEISKLLEEIELLKSENNFYHNEIEIKNKTLDDLIISHKSISSDIEKYKIKTDNLNKVIDEKDKIIENIKLGYNLINSTLDELKNENESLRKKAEEDFNKNKKEPYVEIKSDESSRNDELSKLKETLQKNTLIRDSDLNDYKQKLNASNFEIQRLELNVKEREDVIQKLKIQLENFSAEKETDFITKKDLILSNEILEKEAKELKLSINSLRNDISALNSIIDLKNREYSDLLKSKDVIENETFHLRDKISKMEAEIMNTNDKCMKLINNANLAELSTKSENSKLIDENKKKGVLIETLNAKCDNLNESLISLKDTKDKVKNTYENSLNEMRKNLISANEKENLLTHEVQALNDIINEKEKELNNCKKKLNELEGNIIHVNNKNEKLEEENKTKGENNEQIENRLNELNEKQNEFQKKYNDSINNFGDLNKKYLDMIRLNNKLSAENMLLKEQYDKLKSDFTHVFKDTNNDVSQVKISDKIKSNPLKLKYGDKNPELEKEIKAIKKNFNLDFLREDELLKIVPSFKLKKGNTDYQHDIPNLTKKNSLKIDIKEGSKFLFTVYDSKRILRFDLENRDFKIIEFADYGSFETNFNAEGSIYLNVINGLFVVTGDNNDMFYYFSHEKNSMDKLSKLNDNHSHGSLIFNGKQKNLICLSGWHNRKVERYVNNEIFTKYIQQELISNISNKNINNTWSYLPEMNVERSESSYIIIDDTYLYALFGYCCPKSAYLDSIEVIDLNKMEKWEQVKYSNQKHMSTSIKSHTSIKLNNQEILIIGGFDGVKESPIENFIKFNLATKHIEMNDRKLPDIIFNHCYNFQKDSMMVQFVDVNRRLHYAGIDEMDNVHVVEIGSLQYDIFKFD